MAPDNLQQAWQAQSSQTRVTIDSELLHKEVQRNQRDFLATIFRRDVLEVGTGIVMLPVWLYLGAKYALPWTWYLSEPALLWVAGFFLVDRIRHKRKPLEPGAPLLQTVQESLAQVEHQIWLLRNVGWWYLLPLAIPMLAFFVHVTLLTFREWLPAIAFGGFLFVFLLVVNGLIYYFNQRAVRTQLEPRRQELLALRTALGHETDAAYEATTYVGDDDTPTNLWRWLIVVVACVALLVVVALAGRLFVADFDQPAATDGPAGPALGTLVTEQRTQKHLVGLAAMITVDGQLEAAAASGERKRGSGVPVAIGDRWHLGGVTQSINATMIARLVEAGRLRWTDTVGEIFSAASMHDDWRPVTLRQLLTDTAGAPANFPAHVLRQRPPLGPDCTQARRAAVLEVIADRKIADPDHPFASNVGHTMAAAMAEQATGQTWEDLIKREIFAPLELTESGFGPPASPDEALEQPRGHRRALIGKIAADDKADNTAIMGPAGMIHMTLRDLCTYANDHLQGELGSGKLLAPESYKMLHTPEWGNNAFGWIKRQPSAKTLPVMYWTYGSNTMWYALVAFIPETKMVIAVTANDGDLENAGKAALEVVTANEKNYSENSHAPPNRDE